ncbi:uncharacterized protein LOC110717019 [Chenopodium quinoa]|uniref:uncharacterized protein LOC110717019 n=1 Tax=Chenopodium quinoa TaxID=63459 RepID=UPI000B78F0A5|nr:uncharacterized protein LOC110717019 [Chenopodium quinoa]
MAANAIIIHGRISVKKGGKFDVDPLTLLTISVQALTSKFDKLQTGSSSGSRETCQMCNVQEQPPKGHINVVTLRSGKKLKDSPVKEPSKEVVKEVVINEKVVDSSVIEEEPKASTPPPLAPYVPQVPFPQRLAQAKLEKKYGKFLDNLKKLHINIPFLDAISEMPSYEIFLKDMLSNMKKLDENATVALTAECSAIFQNTIPKKLGDSGSYSILVKLGDIEINKELYDLGASVSLMSLTI